MLSVPFPNDSVLGLPLLFGNLADVGVFEVEDVDRHREFGLGFEIDETKEVGERMERRPAEREEERLCRGLGDNAADDGGFNVEVMSILPPPSTARLCKADRRALSVRDWSAVGRAPGTEVIWIVPVSWAYEYRINSVLFGGKVVAKAVRGWGWYAYPLGGFEGWPNPMGGGRWLVWL